MCKCEVYVFTIYLFGYKCSDFTLNNLFTGSISHHHGVGKHRKKWYVDTVSEPGKLLLLAAKEALDPDNIFALGNMAFDQYKPKTKINLVRSKL